MYFDEDVTGATCFFGDCTALEVEFIFAVLIIRGRVMVFVVAEMVPVVPCLGIGISS
jgi:hypothetical protein